VAEILFFHLSPVIESNVPFVSRYDRQTVGVGWLGVLVVGCTASVLWEKITCWSIVTLGADAAVDVASFPASSE